VDGLELGRRDADAGERLEDTIAREIGNGGIGDVLELAAAAGAEVTAGGLDVIRAAGKDGAVGADCVAGDSAGDKTTGLGHSIAFCAHPDHLLPFLCVSHVTEPGPHEGGHAQAYSEVFVMTRLFLAPALAVSLLAAACAPAPLYSSSGLKRGAATWGEIPRDARGEPLWSAIRPAPGTTGDGPGAPDAQPPVPGAPEQRPE
jgi:hypothetical protein